MVPANDPGLRPRPIIALVVLVPVLMLVALISAFVCLTLVAFGVL